MTLQSLELIIFCVGLWQASGYAIVAHRTSNLWNNYRNPKGQVRHWRQIGADPVYDRIYLQQLKNSNGPKFANDVLPPSAILQQYSVPNYVMAGSFLGPDPQNPKRLPKHNTQSAPMKLRPAFQGPVYYGGYYNVLSHGGDKFFGQVGPARHLQKETNNQVKPTPLQLKKVLMRLALQRILENNGLMKKTS